MGSYRNASSATSETTVLARVESSGSQSRNRKYNDNQDVAILQFTRPFKYHDDKSRDSLYALIVKYKKYAR
jgi:hypothetical protein